MIKLSCIVGKADTDVFRRGRLALSKVSSLGSEQLSRLKKVKCIRRGLGSIGGSQLMQGFNLRLGYTVGWYTRLCRSDTESRRASFQATQEMQRLAPAGWLAGWLVGWLVGWLAGCVSSVYRSYRRGFGDRHAEYIFTLAASENVSTHGAKSTLSSLRNTTRYPAGCWLVPALLGSFDRRINSGRAFSSTLQSLIYL